MSGYAGGYAISPFPTGPGVGTEATDKAVLYWDGVNNLVKGSADFIFNETLKQITLGSGGQFLAPDGTVGAPSYSFSSDTDTGFKLGGAGYIDVVCGGTTYFQFSPGILYPYTDATKDLGSASYRWRAGYFGGVAATIPLTVKAHASQTANLQEWQNSSGAAQMYLDKDFYLTLLAGMRTSNGTIAIGWNGANRLDLGVNSQIGWVSSGGGYSGTRDVILARDAAGVLAQKNGANDQEFRVYGAGGEYHRSVWSGGSFYNITSGAQAHYIGTTGSAVLYLRAYGNHLLFTGSDFRSNVDAQSSLGVAANRWSSCFLGGVAAAVPLTIKLHASQTANALEIQNSSGTPLSRIKSDGRWRHDGATTWNDLRIEPVARSTGANAPSFEKYFDDVPGSSRGVYLYSFNDATAGSEKEIFFTMQMPHDWKEGTAIRLHCHWVGSVSDTTSAPRWGLEYTWKDIGQVFGDTTIVYSTGVNIDGQVGGDPNITAGKHYISEFTAITPGTDANNISSIIIGRLFRDSANAGDTYNAATNKCGLLYIDAHYEVDSFGSDTEFTKG